MSDNVTSGAGPLGVPEMSCCSCCCSASPSLELAGHLSGDDAARTFADVTAAAAARFAR